jgi:hypothetical protein
MLQQISTLFAADNATQRMTTHAWDRGDSLELPKKESSALKQTRSSKIVKILEIYLTIHPCAQ